MFLPVDNFYKRTNLWYKRTNYVIMSFFLWITPFMKPKNQIIVKSNNLLEAGYSLSLQEQRLILSAIAQIDPRPEAPVTLTSQLQFEISVSALSKQMSIDSTHTVN